MKLQPDLMLIGLNTIMLSERHGESMNDIESIEEQLDYFKHYLEKAKVEEMSVLIANHIPFGKNVFNGKDFLVKELEKIFTDVMKDYLDVIIGILVSHTHMEEFQIIRTNEIPQFAQYFTAGVSTSHGNSPSFKVFELENESNGWEIENYSTYQLHENEEDGIVISKFYDFQSTYCEEKDNVPKIINSCLGQINFNQTLPQYTVNNPNYPSYTANDPSAFYIDL